MKNPRRLDEDAELNRLLARGHLSGAEYDAIEKRVLDQTAPKAPRSTLALLGSAVVLAAGFALWFAVRPSGTGVSLPPGETAAGLREKGAARPVLGVVSVGCSGASGHCRLGDTLLFSVNGNTRPVHLLAYAEATDTPGAPRIWYFPRDGATTPEIAAQTGTTVLREGIRLGPPHARGHYRVHVRLSESALGRADADAKGVDGEQDFPLDISE